MVCLQTITIKENYANIYIDEYVAIFLCTIIKYTIGIHSVCREYKIIQKKKKVVYSTDVLNQRCRHVNSRPQSSPERYVL